MPEAVAEGRTAAFSTLTGKKMVYLLQILKAIPEERDATYLQQLEQDFDDALASSSLELFCAVLVSCMVFTKDQVKKIVPDCPRQSGEILAMVRSVAGMLPGDETPKDLGGQKMTGVDLLLFLTAQEKGIIGKDYKYGSKHKAPAGSDFSAPGSQLSDAWSSRKSSSAGSRESAVSFTIAGRQLVPSSDVAELAERLDLLGIDEEKAIVEEIGDKPVLPPYSNGDIVEYYSTTFGKWILARVQALDPASGAIQLDVKAGHWFDLKEINEKVRMKAPEKDEEGEAEITVGKDAKGGPEITVGKDEKGETAVNKMRDGETAVEVHAEVDDGQGSYSSDGYGSWGGQSPTVDMDDLENSPPAPHVGPNAAAVESPEPKSSPESVWSVNLPQRDGRQQTPPRGVPPLQLGNRTAKSPAGVAPPAQATEGTVLVQQDGRMTRSLAVLKNYASPVAPARPSPVRAIGVVGTPSPIRAGYAVPRFGAAHSAVGQLTPMTPRTLEAHRAQHCGRRLFP